ncbi:hypothetical protein QR97_02250 [Streptomyces sp. PBH53]|uniref:hypothetical protein n=1 Tax=Streptomyces sp. PBH53 TaxID=1577075 RepID=UPI000655EC20|nr:hypothetical protein [Streptomyces sp. PBH53]AKN68779.1 hypothetical protein QR97_02250 [Streptomyces sp. PBH53]
MSILEAERVVPEREPKRLFEVTDRMLAALRRGGADLSQLGVPAPDEDEDFELWEDVRVPQARARRLAWRNSMLEAAHGDYLKWRLADLDPGKGPTKLGYQGSEELGGWLDSIVKAKKQRARPSVMNFIVTGNIGSGKTTALAALGNEASERGLWVRFVKHATYLAWRRPDGGPDGMSPYQVRKRHVDEADLLILDELCGEMDGVQTEFVRRETTDLIDSRLASGKPTAFSTNLRREGIVAVLGERLVSRMEDRAYLAKVVGPDRRAPRKPLDW